MKKNVSATHDDRRGAMRCLLVAATALLCLMPALARAEAARELYALSIHDVEHAVADALIRQGAAEAVDVSLSGADEPVLARSARPLHAVVDYLDFDARSQRWEATVSLYEGDTIRRTESFFGRFDAMVELPVLARRVSSGDVIGKDDIAWESFPENRLRKNTVFSERKIVGQAARRVLHAGRPLAAHELEDPVATEKGELVQLTYTTPYMEIRTLGEALEDGAIGEIISIRNTESDIVLRATLIAPGMAEVRNFLQLSQRQDNPS